MYIFHLSPLTSHLNNPVESEFVTTPEDWKYPRARNYQDVEIDGV